MKTLDGGGRRASASTFVGNSANPVKDFVTRRIKQIPSSISVESAANSSSTSLDYVGEPTFGTAQTRLPLNEDCSLDSSDEYRSYRSIRSTPTGSGPSGPRASFTSSVDSGFDGYLQDATSESNELMVEWTSSSEEKRSRSRSKRALSKPDLILGWPSTGNAHQPPRPRHIQSIECDGREGETVEELAQDIIDEISPSSERSQKDTRRRGRRRTDDSDVSNNGLNDSFNSFNSITGR